MPKLPTKKIVRVKTRRPMALTDTPGTADHKVSMDIHGTAPGHRERYLIYTNDPGSAH